ncbi:2'-5' RNA ligase family protein [Nonomuraea sp. NPDC050404]|uniref:2'-5' RNA ligase family protein n=1 Tax=Nonomuraea sp. NPDC050404 TaxID=3155783 RepID=UPI0033F7E82D
MTESRMRDHWWWRPGWRADRRKYTFHATFQDQPALHRLVAAYQAPLSALDGLDLVPYRWLHLTTQDIGFTDEVGDAELTAITHAAALRLAAHSRLRLTFTRPVTDPESLQFQVRPAEPMRAVRHALREAIAEVRGCEGVTGTEEEWVPHMSIAYSNSDGPAEPYEAALRGVDPDPVTVTVRAMQLIVLERDEHLYRWATKATIPLPVARAD